MKIHSITEEVKGSVSFPYKGYDISVSNIFNLSLKIFKGKYDMTEEILNKKELFGEIKNIKKAIEAIDEYLLKIPLNLNISIEDEEKYIVRAPLHDDTLVTNFTIERLPILIQAIKKSKRTDLLISNYAYYSNGQRYEGAFALHLIEKEGEFNIPHDLSIFWEIYEEIRMNKVL